MHQNKLSPFHPIALLATFGVGNIPFAPGTWGSLVAFPIAMVPVFLCKEWALPILAIFSCVLFAVGVWASGQYVKRNGIHDPGEIVVDEVAGQMLVLTLTWPVYGFLYAYFGNYEPWWIVWIIDFILFRIFDILKPWPIRWFDHKVKGGFGVMVDDIVAAMMASLVFYVGVFLYQYSIS